MNLVGLYLIDPKTRQRCRVTGYDMESDHWRVTPITAATLISRFPKSGGGSRERYDGHVPSFRAHSDWIQQNLQKS
jgi:hypothetical protein